MVHLLFHLTYFHPVTVLWSKVLPTLLLLFVIPNSLAVHKVTSLLCTFLEYFFHLCHLGVFLAFRFAMLALWQPRSSFSARVTPVYFKLRKHGYDISGYFCTKRMFLNHWRILGSGICSADVALPDNVQSSCVVLLRCGTAPAWCPVQILCIYSPVPTCNDESAMGD